jgi:hypothetical protein
VTGAADGASAAPAGERPAASWLPPTSAGSGVVNGFGGRSGQSEKGGEGSR